MGKKILLMFPPSIRNSYRMNSPPLGLIELGTYLEKNKINVQLLDFFSLVRRYNEKECIISDKKINLSFDKKIVSNYLFKDKNHKKISKQVNLLLNLIKHKNYSSIVFSISYHSQILSSFILAKELKKIANVKIIFGGQVISNFGLLLFNKFPFIDFIIKGDGKISLVQLLKNKNKKNYAKIGGLIYRKNNKIVENKIKSYKNIEFFHPKYDLLDLSLYYDEHKKLTIPYQISNLCPFNCSFCSYHVNNCLISKPFSIMIKDLKLIINKYNTNDIFFLDSTLNVSLKFLNEFCDSIIQNGVRIKWKALISISNLNVEVISKMKLAGCRFLFIGIESFSELTLKKMNKNIKINKVGRIIRACNKNKIKIIISLIAGFPNENIKELNKTIDFIKIYSKYIDILRIQRFSLDYNSTMFLNPKKFGFKILGCDVLNLILNKDFIKYRLLNNSLEETLKIKENSFKTLLRTSYKYNVKRNFFLSILVPFFIYKFILDHMNNDSPYNKTYDLVIYFIKKFINKFFGKDLFLY